ncbi:MAG TPA: dihydrodipicolinate synthase family protein [Candidatus Acidoferrales bacterium]|jgi:4-hydroxy-2-oxoglutarate aldolase|nr:dihydrodipicolinate synthase family protein [Candidatus Acidoferrales bacterium]
MNLQGIFPPLTAPFARDGSLDLARLRENVGRYNATKLAGYVVNGSTGESVLLGWDEIERAWVAVREAAAPGKVLIAGTGAESTAETIVHTNRAATLGYNAALVRTPSYFKPQMTPEAQAGHFLRVADAARLPILIYSVPVFTGIAVEAPLVARLAQHPNIVGIKESSGDLERAKTILAAAPASFQTLVGSASILHPALAVGAAGAILALSCALPGGCVELYEAARAGDAGRAEVLQRTLEPASKLFSRLGVPALKYALDRLGYYGGPPRPPLLAADEQTRREVDAVLTSLGSSAQTVQ